MTLFIKRAIHDILGNRFLNMVTVITIALSILIVSSFTLFFINATDVMDVWKKGIRIMAYLKPEPDRKNLADTRQALQSITGVQDAVFVSKEEALKLLKAQMHRQASLFENLRENPLPDAFEVRIIPSSQRGEEVERLAARIESLPEIEEVEYGQSWVGKFTSIINLFRLAGYAIGALFFMAAVFIVANTIRIVLYSRREEIEIMRLVGAADGFIKAPFYIEGLILGALGGIIGIGVLFLIFLLISANVQQSVAAGLFQLRFLSMESTGAILVGSMIAGWLGCYLSLKQFLKT
ncbi:MAG: permease-like cell division protein FtsX [Desulfobacterales bacterium]|nr:permease-like cell division protein FtsX [Desulfobacterales bacterium]